MIVAAVGLAGGLGAHATPGSIQAACVSTTVRYQPAKHPTLSDMPWILAEPPTAGIAGFLASYPEALRDSRVNRADGAILWRTGARIIWATFGASETPTIVARRLDRPGSFRLALTSSSEGFVSSPRFPSSGCWQLTVRVGKRVAAVVVRVVLRPTVARCNPTPVESAGAFARPRSSGIRGGWGPWRTLKGGALIYTHGHAGGMNMKVPWWVRRNWGPSLNLTGIRLDATGSFSQEFPMALSPEGVFPSIVDVPSPGCWLLRLRTSRLAGVLVVRAVDSRG